MGGKGNRGSYRASKAGRTRERKGAAPTITKEEKRKKSAESPHVGPHRSTAYHWGTSSLASDDKPQAVDAAQELRRQYHASATAEASTKPLTPAAASFLASLRSEATKGS